MGKSSENITLGNNCNEEDRKALLKRVIPSAQNSNSEFILLHLTTCTFYFLSQPYCIFPDDKGNYFSKLYLQRKLQ